MSNHDDAEAEYLLPGSQIYFADESLRQDRALVIHYCIERPCLTSTRLTIRLWFRPN